MTSNFCKNIFVKYIPTKKYEVYNLHRNPHMMWFVENPSESLQLNFVKKHIEYIRYIQSPCIAVQRYCINKHPYSLQYFADVADYQIQKEAIQKCAYTIKFIENPSEELKEIALKKDPYSRRYMPE